MARFVVRYGSVRQLGLFSGKGNLRIARGSEVVAQTNRGLEIGTVLCEADDRTADRMKNPQRGHIVREATADDRVEWDRLRSQERDMYDRIRRIVAGSGLPMKLVDLEQVLGGEILVIYYLSDDRVDFRNLVKELAGEFRTRIEMRQIGVRDEAKLLADYGDCGKPVCCNTHLHEMPPVSMKMAKLQKASLDPTKISGRCGRLKCCLRYEYDTYVELKKSLPPIGFEATTEKYGVGRVVGHEIVAEQVVLETSDRRRVLLHVSELLSVAKAKRKIETDSHEPPAAEPKEKRRPSRERPPRGPRGNAGGGAPRPPIQAADAATAPPDDPASEAASPPPPKPTGND